MAKHSETIQGTEKEFLDEFQKLCYSRSSWQVWADLMAAMACSISNVADRSPEHYESREKEYAQCIERLGSVEVPAKMLAIIVEALERNPEQDFLGAMYMQLNLGNHWKGQFFTPYCVCKMMSEITCEDVDSHIEKQGYLSICDPACGAGATLIAAANTMKKCKHNFQNHVVFVAQDIDRITGMMCYIQLSLLGCAGYVCIANTITNPLTGMYCSLMKKMDRNSGICQCFKIKYGHGEDCSSQWAVLVELQPPKKQWKKSTFICFSISIKRRKPMETGRNVMHYALGDNQDYEHEWSKAVLEYLENGYSSEDSKSEVEVGNTTYKILKREKVTAFYDADGNTLFDIENDRLKEEYEAMESQDETEPKSEIGRAIAGIEKQAFEQAVDNNIGTDETIPMGTASLEEIAKGIPAPTPEEVETAKKNNSSVYIGVVGAVTKLQEELKKAKDKSFADPIIKHLIERCRKSESLASDVCQDHKTWEKCYKYIYEQARKQAKGSSCAVLDDVVYEWAEDYFHKDDKAEEDKKAKEAAEREKKQKADQQKRLDGMKKRAEKKAKAVEKDKAAQEAPKPEAKAEKPKKEPEKKETPKKRSNELEGQMDLFSMMGL